MYHRNIAEQIYLHLGWDLLGRPSGGKNPSYTKSGPGRKHQQYKLKSKE